MCLPRVRVCRLITGGHAVPLKRVGLKGVRVAHAHTLAVPHVEEPDGWQFIAC